MTSLRTRRVVRRSPRFSHTRNLGRFPSKDEVGDCSEDKQRDLRTRLTRGFMLIEFMYGKTLHIIWKSSLSIQHLVSIF